MSRKGENIYKRKDGRWEGRYIKERLISGKVRYGYVYAKTYRDAKEKLFKTKQKNSFQNITKINNTNNISKNDSILFKSLALIWLKNKSTQIKQSTICKYTNLINLYILPTIGKMKISEITDDTLINLCNVLLSTGGQSGTGLSLKTVSDTFSIIRNILRLHIKRGGCILCDPYIIKLNSSHKNFHTFTPYEQQKLCHYIFDNPTSRNIGILICLFTGLRIGEICALHWEDISITNKTIYVHRTMQRVQVQNNKDKKTEIIVTTPKTECSIRTIPLPSNLVQIISETQNISNGFFLGDDKHDFIEPRTMQNHFRRVLKCVAIKYSNFHTLRHTFATRCIELGFEIKSLSEILGHSNVNITMNRYVHPSMTLKKDNMEKLSKLLAVK